MGHGRSSATAKRGLKQSIRVRGFDGEVKSIAMKVPGAASGFTYDAFSKYQTVGGDKQILDAQLKGDTASTAGKMAAAMEKYMAGKSVGGDLHRGIAVDKKTLSSLKRGKFPNRETMSSWSHHSGVAYEFANGSAYENSFSGNGKSIPVMFTLRGGMKNAVEMDKTVSPKHLTKQGGKFVQASSYSEQEVLGSKVNKFRIVGYDESSYKKRGIHQFLVEQI